MCTAGLTASPGAVLLSQPQANTSGCSRVSPDLPQTPGLQEESASPTTANHGRAACLEQAPSAVGGLGWAGSWLHPQAGRMAPGCWAGCRGSSSTPPPPHGSHPKLVHNQGTAMAPSAHSPDLVHWGPWSHVTVRSWHSAHGRCTLRSVQAAAEETPTLRSPLAAFLFSSLLRLLSQSTMIRSFS